MAKAKKKANVKKVAAKKPASAQKKSKKAAPIAKKAKPAPKKSAAKSKTKTVAKKTAPAPANKGKSLKNLAQIISPLDDRVLIRVEAGERVTAGGLILPDTAQISGNLKGSVVAVGRGHLTKKGKLHPIELKIGDRVVFAEFSGSKVKIADEELVILREKEILGVLET